jgi:hypothetical protein
MVNIASFRKDDVADGFRPGQRDVLLLSVLSDDCFNALGITGLTRVSLIPVNPKPRRVCRGFFVVRTKDTRQMNTLHTLCCCCCFAYAENVRRPLLPA